MAVLYYLTSKILQSIEPKHHGTDTNTPMKQNAEKYNICTSSQQTFYNGIKKVQQRKGSLCNKWFWVMWLCVCRS